MPHMKPKRVAVQHEKIEQQHIVQLATTLFGKDCVYVLGTRRSRGKACPQCGTFVAEHQGTRQTPGHPDLVMFVPHRINTIGGFTYVKRVLYWETKRSDGGRTSPEQETFLRFAREAGVHTGVGDFDSFIAWCCDGGFCRTDQFPHYRQLVKKGI